MGSLADNSPHYGELDDDAKQESVIAAAPDARLLVGAGPGTGKTAVACARIAKLIDVDGVEPSHIWFISFTRTAVAEMRNRIRSLLKDPGVAYSVRVATLDSHAWAIHSGFDENAKITSYDDNIEKLLELVQTHEGVSEYLGEVAHLVVDEAQDTVGPRAELVLRIIGHLSEECGVTIFSDDAQAIYGFSTDDKDAALGERQQTLPEALRARPELGFAQVHLETVHRTKSPKLLTIFTKTRQKVLAPSDAPEAKLRGVKDDVAKLAEGQVLDITEQREQLEKLSDVFVLYRRRADVLLASSFLGDLPHRIRMSGLPHSLHAWVGRCLAEHTSSKLARDGFRDLWKSQVKTATREGLAWEAAWAHLVRLAGDSDSVIDMRRVRGRLGRSQPPAELCTHEIGHGGPIIGTIHASKGREADVVHLMLPGDPGDKVDHDEEARVVFVGATRARIRLMVGKGYRQFNQKCERSGRVFSLKTADGKPRAQVEIGHTGDITAQGVAGREIFKSPQEVRANQVRLGSLLDKTIPITALSDHAAGHIYKLFDEKSRLLGHLSQTVNFDLFEVARAIQRKIRGPKRRPPNDLRYLRLVGVRSIVLPPDSPEAELLHDPWRKSGIVLAPVVIGYTTAFFPY